MTSEQEKNKIFENAVMRVYSHPPFIKFEFERFTKYLHEDDLVDIIKRVKKEKNELE